MDAREMRRVGAFRQPVDNAPQRRAGGFAPDRRRERLAQRGAVAALAAALGMVALPPLGHVQMEAHDHLGGGVRLPYFRHVLVDVGEVEAVVVPPQALSERADAGADVDAAAGQIGREGIEVDAALRGLPVEARLRQIRQVGHGRMPCPAHDDPGRGEIDAGAREPVFSLRLPLRLHAFSFHVRPSRLFPGKYTAPKPGSPRKKTYRRRPIKMDKTEKI